MFKKIPHFWPNRERERERERESKELPRNFNIFCIKNVALIFICVLYLFFGLIPIKHVEAAGWLSGYSYRKLITVSNTNIASDISYFPILIASNSDSDVGAGVIDSTYGYDVRFTDSDGTTLLPYEKENFSVTSGSASYNFWVRIPTVYHSPTGTQNQIYIYYGNSSDSGSDWTSAASLITNCTSITNARCVWKEGTSQNFITVYHMKDGADSSHIYDSTSNNYTGTKGGVATPVEVNGQIGKGENFAAGNIINISPSSTSGTYTVTGWYNLTSTSGAGRYLLDFQTGRLTFELNQWAAGDIGATNLGYYSGAATTDSGIAPGTGIWNFAAFSVNNGGTGTVYKNGSPVASSLSYTATNIGGAGAIGNRYADNGSTGRMVGTLDEIRISSVARTADWIKFSYCNAMPTTISGCTVPAGGYQSNEIAFNSQESVSTSLSSNVSTIYKNSTGNSITLTGIGTAWSAGTPGTPTFSLSGGIGASITSQIVNSDTSATVIINAGSVASTLTITDPSNGNTVNITVVPTTLSSNVSTISINSVNNSIVLTGGGTSWTAGTPGTPIFTLSGGAGASIISQVVNNTTQTTLVISAGSASGALTITDPTTGNTVNIAVANYLHHILSDGQSLSIGALAATSLTITQPYNNKMLNSGKTTFIPLVEPSTGASGSETPSSALANTMSSETSNNYDSIVTLNGVSGAAYSGLKKGTNSYNNGLAQITAAKNLSVAASIPYVASAVTIIHGEADESAGTTAAQYEADLVEWQSDFQTDIKAITGQTDNIPMFVSQVSSWTGYSHQTPTTAIGQLNAAINNPNSIYLVTPQYIFNYNNDHAHLTSPGYRRLGEYFGKVMKKVLVDHQDWKPLYPTLITRSGNVITAKFHVPVGSLAFDTSLVSAARNYGFEYYDNSSSASISNVAITESDTVQITLNTTPTGSNQRLRYAFTGGYNSSGNLDPACTSPTNCYEVPGINSTYSPKGNLRDTDTTPALYQDANSASLGNYLYNWGVTFDESVTNDSTAPSISSVSSGTPTSNGATVTWTTNENSSSKVEYGLTNGYGTTTPETDTSTRVSSHTVSLTDLASCTTYHYRIKSKDSALNEAIGTDNNFTTSGCTASAIIDSQSSSQVTIGVGGTLSLLDSNSHGIGLSIPVSFSGTDANFQAHQLDTNTVLAVTSNPTGYLVAGDYIYELKALTNNSTTITSFDNPITITITYGSADIVGIDESTLKIYRWDGSVWNQGVDCVVNTNTKTVTCTTTHFSTFGLFGQTTATPTPTPTPISTNSQSNTSNSSNSSSSSTTGCHDSSPVLISDLFQINTTSNNAKLFFTPIDTNQFYVSFSTKPNAEDYGELVTLAREGVQSHTIYLLKPNTTYYIKVRGQNGCATGNWSNIMTFTTPSSTKQKIFYKNSKLAVITNGIKSIVNKVSKIVPTKNTTNKTNTKISSPTAVPTVAAQTKVSPSPTPTVKFVEKKKTCILWWCF